MKRNTAAIIFLMLLVCVGFGAAGFYMHRAEQYESAMAREAKSALGKLSYHVNAIGEDILKMSRARGEGYTHTLAADISSHCKAAGELLPAFAGESGALERIDLYIDKVGAYAMALASGGANMDEREEKLNGLYRAHTALRDKLSELFNSAMAGGDRGAIMDALKELDGGFEDVPLSYDGEHSDHLKELTPALCESLDEISPEDAMVNAEWYLGLSRGELTLSGESGGEVPCYIFEGNGNTALITKAGGLLLAFSKQAGGGGEMSESDASRAASRWLEDHGFKKMEASRVLMGTDEASIEFYYKDQNITFLPDRVSLTVSLKDGEITGGDFRDYIMNHKSRVFPSPAFPSPSEGASLAVIQSAGKRESLCWQVPSEDDTHSVISYHDAATGEQMDLKLTPKN